MNKKYSKIILNYYSENRDLNYYNLKKKLNKVKRNGIVTKFFFKSSKLINRLIIKILFR